MDGVCLAGDAGAVCLKRGGQRTAPQNGQVRFRRRPQIVKRMQHAEGSFRHQRAAIQPHAPHGFGDPHGVAAEQRVVLRRTQVARHTQLHHKVVHQLLRARLVQPARGQVPLEIDIQKRAHAAQAHGRAVLLLDGPKVAEVGPLHGLAGTLRRAADVAAVQRGHIPQLAQKVDLPPDLLDETDVLVRHRAAAQLRLVLFLFLDQSVCPVERHAAVIADDPAPAICVGQARDQAAVPGRTGLLVVHAEYAVVVGGAVGELLLHLPGKLIAVGPAGLPRHADASERIHTALQRPVRLQADDQLVVFVQIARLVIEQGGHRLGVHIQHAAELLLQLHQALQLMHQCLRARCCRRQERFISSVGCIVFLDKIPHIDAALPRPGRKPFPCLAHFLYLLFAHTPRRRGPFSFLYRPGGGH